MGNFIKGLKDHVEIEALKAMTYEQINEILNKQHRDIESLKKDKNNAYDKGFQDGASAAADEIGSKI